MIKLVIVIAFVIFVRWLFSGPSHNMNGEIDECIGCPYRTYGMSYCEENCKWFTEIKEQ